MSFPHRSALAKFGCGVTPLTIETRCYDNLPENDRLCTLCLSNVESESHVLLECPIFKYDSTILINY